MPDQPSRRQQLNRLFPVLPAHAQKGHLNPRKNRRCQVFHPISSPLLKGLSPTGPDPSRGGNPRKALASSSDRGSLTEWPPSFPEPLVGKVAADATSSSSMESAQVTTTPLKGAGPDAMTCIAVITAPALRWFQFGEVRFGRLVIDGRTSNVENRHGASSRVPNSAWIRIKLRRSTCTHIPHQPHEITVAVDGGVRRHCGICGVDLKRNQDLPGHFATHDDLVCLHTAAPSERMPPAHPAPASAKSFESVTCAATE